MVFTLLFPIIKLKNIFIKPCHRFTSVECNVAYMYVPMDSTVWQVTITQ